jgi:hypothetical protein
MPLKLRHIRSRLRHRQGPPGLHHLQRRVGGRPHQTRGGPDSLRWFWSMPVTGPMTRSDRVATLGGPRRSFRRAGALGRRGRSWKRWSDFRIQRIVLSGVCSRPLFGTLGPASRGALYYLRLAARPSLFLRHLLIGPGPPHPADWATPWYRWAPTRFPPTFLYIRGMLRPRALRVGSSRFACPSRPPSLRRAALGCTRSSTMASGS